MIWRLNDLIASAGSVLQNNVRGEWVPARPLPGPFVVRLRAAWLVLTGKADAVVWPSTP